MILKCKSQDPKIIKSMLNVLPQKPHIALNATIFNKSTVMVKKVM